MFNKLNFIIGNNSSGKTTFLKLLCNKLNLCNFTYELYTIDNLYELLKNHKDYPRKSKSLILIDWINRTIMSSKSDYIIFDDTKNVKYIKCVKNEDMYIIENSIKYTHEQYLLPLVRDYKLDLLFS